MMGVEVSFVSGKCRTAPIKKFSIPRLELPAALYSVRLRTLIVQEMTYILAVLLMGLIVTVLQWSYSADKKTKCFCN